MVPITAGPDSVTVTPGRTPPWSSVTLPTSSPNIWPVCAAAGDGPKASTMVRAVRARKMARVTGDLLERLQLFNMPARIVGFSRWLGGKVHSFFAKTHVRFGDLDSRTR